ncbi:hypothetical protein UFOVP347_50 [uncultured Caudovirales phage]|uniref:Uncharacterized protein n=1 Tax=uncultured Caudovirales phage TaxID=2100421 RepID=A0A6J5M3L2_9CAUD|nr:hypothetical protein UFOVP347_50 [uncultured Caudovirales phage]
MIDNIEARLARLERIIQVMADTNGLTVAQCVQVAKRSLYEEAWGFQSATREAPPQPLVDTLRRRTQEARTLRSRLYDSEGVPAGFDTVLGYLSKHCPEHLALIDHMPSATSRDGWWLCHRIRERGLPLHSVPACAFLRAHGIERVNAYPVGLLRERFG